MIEAMLIRIVTSCTGEKNITHDRQLTLADFEQGPAHVAGREAEFTAVLTPAIDLYSGLQHQRLRRGLQAVESNRGSGISTETWIVSAGYGLIPGHRKVAPYEATFMGLSSKQRGRWARQLHLPSDMRNLLAESADLILVLLGDDPPEAYGPTTTSAYNNRMQLCWLNVNSSSTALGTCSDPGFQHCAGFQLWAQLVARVIMREDALIPVPVLTKYRPGRRICPIILRLQL